MALHQIDNSEPLLAPGSAKPYMLIQEEDGSRTPAYPSEMIRLLLQRAPVKTMADSHHALRVYDVIKADDEGVTPAVLKFEDADHAWLLKSVEEAGPVALGVMAARLKDALQPMSVSERRKAKSQKKTEPEPGE